MPPTAPSQTAPRSRWPLFAALFLGAVLLAAYANSFRVPFLFDDPSSITENLTLRSWRTAFLPPSDSGITVSGRPLLNATFALNWALGRDNVTGYHVVNLLIHFATALTLFGLTRRALLLPLSSTLYPPAFSASATPLALAVSALWALHPLQTESVTYIVQRAEALVGLFYLLTLYGFVRSIDTPTASSRWRLFTVLACLAGMASKEVMVSAPLIVFLFDRTFVSGSFARAWRSHKKLHLALAATWLLLAVCIISTGNRGGTVGVGSGMSAWHYFLTQCHAIVHYLRLTFWPHPLVLDYGDDVITSLWDVFGQLLLLLALGTATVWALWKKPIPGFLGAVFFAVLAPTSSIIPVNTQTMAEHRMYLALAPVVIVAVVFVQRMLRVRAFPVFFVAALALATATSFRNHDYRDAWTIWTDTREKAPLNTRAYTNLAKLHIEKNEYPAALALLNRSLELNPLEPSAWVGIANIHTLQNRPAEGFAGYERALTLAPGLFDIHYNYGKALLEYGDVDKAIAHMQTALKIKPGSDDARHNLANAFAAARRYDEAISAYRQVLQSSPDAIDTRNNLAATLIKIGRPTDAIPLLEQNIRRSPDDAQAHLILGRCHIALRQPAIAANAFAEAVRLDPSLKEARANLAHALRETGRPADAIAHYQAALRLGLEDARIHLHLGHCFLVTHQLAPALEHHRKAASLDPASAEIRHHLARLLLQTGHPDEALGHYQELVRLAPGADAYNELGIALAQLNRLSEAADAFARALQLRPDFTEARDNLARAQSASAR